MFFFSSQLGIGILLSIQHLGRQIRDVKNKGKTHSSWLTLICSSSVVIFAKAELASVQKVFASAHVLELNVAYEV